MSPTRRKDRPVSKDKPVVILLCVLFNDGDSVFNILNGVIQDACGIEQANPVSVEAVDNCVEEIVTFKLF